MERIDFTWLASWQKTLWGTKKSIGSVSQKVLASQLRDMEGNGPVNRRVSAKIPVYVIHKSFYRITNQEIPMDSI